jgi:hypothetical protein
MKRRVVTTVMAVLGFAFWMSAQQRLSSIFHNERLKTNSYPDTSIVGNDHSRLVTGFWVSESKDPAKSLVFPQQVRIRCTRYNKECAEISVTIAASKDLVSIQDIDDTTYEVNKWDAHGVTASYGGDPVLSPCQRHVLTMDFDSGAVSVSDIPTRKKGCEMFTETDSYRLERGFYYVDTSPGNDADKVKR